MKHTGLGRGLDALIDTSHVAPQGGSSISEIALELIEANPDQPRRTFDEQALGELADSIREHGVISPITLRQQADGKYMIIAGERRFRASQMVGLKTIPAYIRTAKDEQVLEMALIENIQRENLDAIEIALAFQRLMDEYHLTQEKMAEKVGMKRATVANYLRLLRLPAEIQMALKKHTIEMGHAKALLSLESAEKQLALFLKIEKEGLSVRRAEELVGRCTKDKCTMYEGGQKNNKGKKEFKVQEKVLEERLGLKVSIGKGLVKIPFKTIEELNELMEHIR